MFPGFCKRKSVKASEKSGAFVICKAIVSFAQGECKLGVLE